MMRVWFPSERHAVEFAESVCRSTELRVAWMEGAVIQLATIHVERDEADNVQSVVERTSAGRDVRLSHAAATFFGECADQYLRWCIVESLAACRQALEDLRGGTEPRTQPGDERKVIK